MMTMMIIEPLFRSFWSGFGTPSCSVLQNRNRTLQGKKQKAIIFKGTLDSDCVVQFMGPGPPTRRPSISCVLRAILRWHTRQFSAMQAVRMLKKKKEQAELTWVTS